MKNKFLATSLALLVLFMATAVLTSCDIKTMLNKTEKPSEQPASESVLSEEKPSQDTPDTTPTCEHVAVIDPAVAPTCIENGKSEGYHCSKCGFVLMAQTVLPTTGHSWQEATCEKPKTCSVCAATEGSAAGHNWQDATCEKPKTCSVCSATEGSAAGHSWQKATCEKPKTCSVCAATEGSAAGHSWQDATYTTPKTCSVCKDTEGSVRNAHTDLYNLIVKKGEKTTSYYFWQTSGPADNGNDSYTYLVAEIETKEIHLMYSSGDLTVLLDNLTVGKPSSYTTVVTFNSINAGATIYPASFLSTQSLYSYVCSNSYYSDTMKNILKSGTTVIVLAAEQKLQAEGNGLSLRLFGFTELSETDPQPPQPPVLEPATPYSTEWIEWLTNEDRGDSRKYPLLEGSVYNGCYIDTVDESSGWEVWPYSTGVTESSRFHFCLRMSTAKYAPDPITCESDYTWKVYYRDLYSTGSYSMIETAPWSAFIGGESSMNVYRLPLLDDGMKKMNEGDIYHMVFFIFDQYGDLVGWLDAEVEWNEASEKYYDIADELGLLGKSPVTPPDDDTYTYAEILQMTGSCPETTKAGIYNRCYYYDDEDPSGWEFWPFIETGEVNIMDFSRFHLCVMLDPLVFDAREGLSSYGSDGHLYTWKVFYRDFYSNDNFKMVECQPWSAGGCWTIYDEFYVIYRLPLMDCGMEKLFDDGFYEMVFVIYDENGNVACWFEQDVKWNAASNAYYEEAYYRGYIHS